MNALTGIGRCLTLAGALVLSACGSDSDGGDGDSAGTGGASGSGGTSGSGGGSGSNGGDRCALDITLSGDATLELDSADPISCITAYTTAPGAYVAFGPAPVVDVGAVALSFPELEPEETATALELPMTIHHADRTQFSPMGCVVDVTENEFDETIEGGDVYRVVGSGSCSEAGVNGDRSISVVGTFRFIAPIRWQN